MDTVRTLAGIPEDELIAQYAGKYLKQFDIEKIVAWSVSMKVLLEVPVLRWYITPRLRISMNYTGTAKAIIITCKNKLSEGYSGYCWGYMHELVTTLHDPNGIIKAEEFISDLVKDAWANCSNSCCKHKNF